MTATAVILGERELMKAIDQLTGSAQRRIARPAIRAAASIVNKAAKSNLPRRGWATTTSKGRTFTYARTGALRRSIGVKMKTYRNSGAVVAIVGPRSKPSFKAQIPLRSRVADPLRYAHLLERGTKFSKARPFLRPALDNNRVRIRQTLIAKMREGLRKEAERAARKAARRRAA